MNKRDAAVIAESITNDQLAAMFEAAKIGITDWQQVSSVNKGLTKGTAWNILYPAFQSQRNKHFSDIGKRNMVWEFGDFLDDKFKPPKKKKSDQLIPHHQSPVF